MFVQDLDLVQPIHLVYPLQQAVNRVFLPKLVPAVGGLHVAGLPEIDEHGARVGYSAAMRRMFSGCTSSWLIPRVGIVAMVSRSISSAEAWMGVRPSSRGTELRMYSMRMHVRLDGAIGQEEKSVWTVDLGGVAALQDGETVVREGLCLVLYLRISIEVLLPSNRIVTVVGRRYAIAKPRRIPAACASCSGFGLYFERPNVPGMCQGFDKKSLSASEGSERTDECNGEGRFREVGESNIQDRAWLIVVRDGNRRVEWIRKHIAGWNGGGCLKRK